MDDRLAGNRPGRPGTETQTIVRTLVSKRPYLVLAESYHNRFPYCLYY